MPDDTPIDAQALLDAIAAAAALPESVTSDAGSVKQHSLANLLAAHKYLSALAAMQVTPRTSGLRFAQLLPPGTVQRGYYPSDASSGPTWRRF